MADGMRSAAVPLVRGNIVVLAPRRLLREAMRCLLGSTQFSVVGEGATLADALRGVAPECGPDLMLYAFGSNDEADQQLHRIAEARVRFAGVKLIIFADGLRTETLRRAVQAGIEAILSEDISADAFQRALELVLLGHRLLPEGLTRALLEPASLAREARDAASPPIPRAAPSRLNTEALSNREQQILQCLVDGLSNKLIARRLGIAEATVKVHVKGLLRKTRMANRTQAAIWALNNGLPGVSAVAENAAAPEAVQVGCNGGIPLQSAVNDTRMSSAFGVAGAWRPVRARRRR